jgi:hypothetical protein
MLDYDKDHIDGRLAAKIQVCPFTPPVVPFLSSVKKDVTERHKT